MKRLLMVLVLGLAMLTSASGFAADEGCDPEAGIEACAAVLEAQLSARGTIGMVIYCCAPKEISGRTFFKVVTVRAGMAFAGARVEVDDYVSPTAINGELVNTRSREDFDKLHLGLKQGDTVTYLVQHGDELREIEVVAGAPSQEWLEFTLQQKLNEAGFSEQKIKKWLEHRQAG